MKKFALFILVILVTGAVFGQEHDIPGLALASVAYFNESIKLDQEYIIRDILIINGYIGNSCWSVKNFHGDPDSVLNFILYIPPHFLPLIEGRKIVYSNALTVNYNGRIQAETTNGFLRMFHCFILVDVDELRL